MCALHYWPSGSHLMSYGRHLGVYFKLPSRHTSQGPFFPPFIIPSSNPPTHLPTILIRNASIFAASISIHPSVYLRSRSSPACFASCGSACCGPPFNHSPFCPLIHKTHNRAALAAPRLSYGSRRFCVAPLLDIEKSFYLLLPHVWSQLPVGNRSGALRGFIYPRNMCYQTKSGGLSRHCCQKNFFDFPT